MRLASEHMEVVTTIAGSETLSAVLDRKGRSVFFVEPGSTVFEAIERMAERHVGALLVMDGDALVGVISERDYARKVILQGKMSRETRVDAIMSRPVISAAPGMSVGDGLRLMTEKRVRHLPIVNPDSGAVEGIVSIGDLVRSVMSAQAQRLQQLTSYIAGSYPA
ncbi:MAG: CBS domain-containing protein [Bryobacteraceae bacterium]